MCNILYILFCVWIGGQFNIVLLRLYVADPATILDYISVLGTLFSSKSSLFFSVMEKLNISEFALLPH